MKSYERIKQYLEDNGIKQKYIAEKTGIQENKLSLTLNGQRIMTADELIKIIYVLNLDANKFVYGD